MYICAGIKERSSVMKDLGAYSIERMKSVLGQKMLLAIDLCVSKVEVDFKAEVNLKGKTLFSNIKYAIAKHIYSSVSVLCFVHHYFEIELFTCTYITQHVNYHRKQDIAGRQLTLCSHFIITQVNLRMYLLCSVLQNVP